MYKLDQILDQQTIRSVINQINGSRKYIGDDNYSYDDIEKMVDDKTYLIKGS